MRPSRTMRRLLLPGLCALSAFVGSANAQVPPPHGGGQGDPMEKIKELFNEVGRDLDEIDRLLLEASSPRAARQIEETLKKMNDLLDTAGKKQGEAAKKMDDIIQMIPRQGGGGGGQSQQPPPKSPPQEGQEGQQPRESENRSDKPQELDSQRDSQNPQNSNSRNQPESPEEESGDPFVQDGPDQARKQQEQRKDLEGGWSVHLPPKEVQVFKNHLRDTQIPERYHRMIERWRQIRR